MLVNEKAVFPASQSFNRIPVCTLRCAGLSKYYLLKHAMVEIR